MIKIFTFEPQFNPTFIPKPKHSMTLTISLKVWVKNVKEKKKIVWESA